MKTPWATPQTAAPGKRDMLASVEQTATASIADGTAPTRNAMRLPASAAKSGATTSQRWGQLEK